MSRKLFIVGLVVVVLGVLAYFGFGMPGMNHQGARLSRDSMPTMRHGFDRLTVGEFAARSADPLARVINVHIPYAGELAATDLFIPFDRVVADPQLPTDRAAAIALYCRSGRMSQVAGEALVRAGYTNVVDLRGGMQAWLQSGRKVLRKNR